MSREIHIPWVRVERAFTADILDTFPELEGVECVTEIIIPPGEKYMKIRITPVKELDTAIIGEEG